MKTLSEWADELEKCPGGTTLAPEECEQLAAAIRASEQTMREADAYLVRWIAGGIRCSRPYVSHDKALEWAAHLAKERYERIEVLEMFVRDPDHGTPHEVETMQKAAEVWQNYCRRTSPLK